MDEWMDGLLQARGSHSAAFAGKFVKCIAKNLSPPASTTTTTTTMPPGLLPCPPDFFQGVYVDCATFRFVSFCVAGIYCNCCCCYFLVLHCLANV